MAVRLEIVPQEKGNYFLSPVLPSPGGDWLEEYDFFVVSEGENKGFWVRRYGKDFDPFISHVFIWSFPQEGIFAVGITQLVRAVAEPDF